MHPKKEARVIQAIAEGCYSQGDLIALVADDVAAAFHDFARAKGWATGSLDVPFKVVDSAYRADLLRALERA